ncbi:unnamed protein product [Adineta steineri]|uniref:Ubiquitin carboxyl-terminal hydrolase n=1 Tax=Adineta steineri TaxID=433720 RepID=A0A813ZAJ8_9BILA|nr:unnamed protein product [Adineta steineri]CAF3610841.1 unnamed protein product [Adineta steineri]
MNRQGPRYDLTSSTSTHSSIYNGASRPLRSVTNTNVASLGKHFQSDSTNTSTITNSRTRPLSRFNQLSSERPTRTIFPTIQSTRLPSQDRSNVQTNKIANNSYTEPYITNPTVTVYSISSASRPTNYTDNESPILKSSSNERYTNQSSSSVINESRLSSGGLCGLQNLGNTCFMNSVLQCLSNTKPLLLFCLQDDLENHLNQSTTSVMKGVLMKEYANLIHKMWLLPEGRSIVSPSSFKNTIGKFAPRFTGYSEQDSQEFLRYLLQGLSEDVNRVSQKPTPITIDEKQEERMREKDRAEASWKRCLRFENSRIIDIFGGQLKSTLECSYCQYQSITFDMFWDLSIPLPRDKSSTSLQECIQLFMNREELDGNEKPMCAKCKQKRPCTKQLSIQRCPEILVLHLKRFSQTYSRAKLNTYVDFPITNLRLDKLHDVMTESYQGPIPTYNLIGISNHSGSVYSGHYIAQCKHPFTNEWHEFNDSSVHLISDNTRIVSSNAYVLFYERQTS